MIEQTIAYDIRMINQLHTAKDTPGPKNRADDQINANQKKL